MTASARMAWAAELVAPRPADRVLEIGSGHGVLVGLLAGRVPDGHVTGLDRSAAMTAAATRANAQHVDAGRATLVTGRVQDLAAGTGPCDVVVAMRVREVWQDAAALAVIDRVLADDGRLVLVLDSPAGRVADAVVDEVRDSVAAAGLEVVDVRAVKLPTGWVTGVVARRTT